MKLTLFLLAFLTASAGTTDFRQALDLYDSGMYGRARTVLESLPKDEMTDGYILLCALKMRSDDYPQLLDGYLLRNPSSALMPQVHLENAMRLFDDGKYSDASDELALVGEKEVPSDRLAEYLFKTGYCHFSGGKYPEAMAAFTRLDSGIVSDYAPAARYLNGVMNYNTGSFEEAEEWFGKSVKDPRFAELSQFYIVDCEFNRKNYDYVIFEGGRIYENSPQERKDHLARMISESYLVKGDKEKAREFYDNASRIEMNRSDYFYAGSVLYAVDDYKGAVENFSRMTDRTDSLGQIANYQMGNAYVCLRNKVAAMDAFRDAAMVDHDPRMTEDAYFNYAKLAFDLNKDTGAFANYIKRYSTKTRGEQIYSYMALADLYDRDYAGAVAAYDNIDELDADMRRNYAKANYLRAEQLISSESWRDAVPFLRASAYYVPKNDRFNQLSRFWMAESQFKTGNYDDARKVYTELFNGSALMGMEEGSALPYNIAYCYLKQGDCQSAIKWFDQYLKDGSGSFRKDALLRRSDCYFASRDYKGAIASYQEVIDAAGSIDDVYPYYRQALAYGLSGDRKKKVAVLNNIVDADPSAPYYSDALYELGRTQMDLKSNADAIITFKKMQNTAPDKSVEARAMIGLGMVNRNAGNYERALDYYKKVVSSVPGSEYSENAMLAIESIYQKLRQPEKYLEYVEENSLALSKSEGDKEQMYYNTAEQVYLAGNYAQAVVSLQKYLDNYPEGERRNDAVFYMAESFKSLGEKEKACDYYRQVMDSGADNSFGELSRLRYADISYGLERYADAYGGYEALLNTARIDSNKEAARIGMMRSAFRGKDYESAINSATDVKADAAAGSDISREAAYVLAKSCFSTSKREKAMAIFRELSSQPSTPEGAESRYILVQDAYDTGRFESVEQMVYDFSSNAGDQSYWLARTYIVLGDTFVEQGKTAQAKATYESIRDGYAPAEGSSDDIAENIRVRLERLEKLNK